MKTILTQTNPQEFAKIIEAGGGITKFLSHSEILKNSEGHEVEEISFFQFLCTHGTTSQIECALNLLSTVDPTTSSSLLHKRDKR